MLQSTVRRSGIGSERNGRRQLLPCRTKDRIAGRMATDMKPQLGRDVQRLRELRGDLQAHLERMMLRMKHLSPDDASAFEGLCVELEDYLKDLGSHAQLEMELL